MYDNTLEYWVVVKERGTQEESREIEERRRTVEKARHANHLACISHESWIGSMVCLQGVDGPEICDNQFASLKDAEALMTCEPASGSAAVPTEAAAMVAQNEQVRGCHFKIACPRAEQEPLLEVHRIRALKDHKVEGH